MKQTLGDDAPAVETNTLSKRFGSREVVVDVGLKVAAGQIFGFLGRNGAGKTTVIRLILGLLRPTGGAVRIFGHDVARQRIAAARLTGSLLEARATYDHLTGRENLDGARRLLGLPAVEIDRVLDVVDLAGAQTRKVGHYSLGMRQRLGLARALLGSPKLVVLDEPMNGLDPEGIREMRDLIRDLPARSGVTLFLSSHLLSEVQQTASHIGLMHEGRLVLQGPIGDLLSRAAPKLFIRTADRPAATSILIGSGYAPTPDGDGLVIALKGGDREGAALNRRLVAAGLDVSELSPRAPTLEALYHQVQLTQAEAA